MTRTVCALSGVAVFLAIVLAPIPGLETFAPRATLAVVALMVVWWVTQAVPLWVTALAPLAILPVAGALAPKPVALEYANKLIFLFLGGMWIGAAMEDTGLHRRIALTILRAVGRTPFTVLLGMLAATAFLSLWISNTATAVMMVPIAMAVLGQVEARHGREAVAPLGTAMALSVAYGANLGGIGTKIGTAPNVMLAGFARDHFEVQMTFSDYLAVGLPVVLLLFPLAFAVLAWVARRSRKLAIDPGAIRGELAKLGPMSLRERVVAWVFVGAVAAWIIEPLAWGDAWDYDWVVALAAGGVLLLVPGGRGWLRAVKIPWGILILLGGGFAMAASVKGSGLAGWMAGNLAGLSSVPIPLAVLVVAVASVFLTSVMSNTAMTAMMLPIVAEALGVGGADGVRVCAAVALGSSCDFMLPAGTPPNAVVFATGRVTAGQMARAGFALDLACGPALAAILLVNPFIPG